MNRMPFTFPEFRRSHISVVWVSRIMYGLLKDSHQTHSYIKIYAFHIYVNQDAFST